jgi:ankyrin repeat protein
VNAQKRIDASRCGSGIKRKQCLDAKKPEPEKTKKLDRKKQKQLDDALLDTAWNLRSQGRGLNNAEEILRLIKAGANVNAKKKWGGTVLMGAASVGATRICELLLENGANIEAKTRYGGTAFNWADNSMHDETAALLAAVSALDKVIGMDKRPLFLSDLRKCIS